MVSFNYHGKTRDIASLGPEKLEFIKFEVLISNLGKYFLIDQTKLELICL